ncbi:hypothetical protein G6F57_004523 [Rhizopus arrhizus]|uniref:Uncharacterized protein n=1 Tax=Rhizopus oryzae TaxID=64495 RepID=A0A9P6XCN7_RHIOR|nr:hypothetical protein G6F24_004228 [Rhizopus arrhizus]KAG1426787.1 hypothetical protein G6F58_001335 [Rhizopus delemar]KAG0792467.1 hypothetical protein G6F21_004334 [Rhizopus arrhizus]KAG0794407.1 hypothetical protein G6F22_005363 [Rhizopus arrhizus]KAG0813542.1 hypothetical protein G6F20_005486 [Rhizopus arrhizus]
MTDDGAYGGLDNTIKTGFWTKLTTSKISCSDIDIHDNLDSYRACCVFNTKIIQICNESIETPSSKTLMNAGLSIHQKVALSYKETDGDHKKTL